MIPKPQPLTDGLVVLFEGIDGVGKTTQVDLARQELESAGWPILSTRNLGGTPIGEALRVVIKSMMKRPPLTDLYISLAIQEALLLVIGVARSEGKIILLDRGPLSLAAYQIYGAGIDESIGWPYVQDGMDRLKPELVILYSTDAKRAVERARQLSGKADYFESQPLSYFERVAAGYAAASKRYALQTIDAGQSIETIHEQSMSLISQAISQKLSNYS